MSYKNKNFLKIPQIAPKALSGGLGGGRKILVFFTLAFLVFSFNFRTAEAAKMNVPHNSLGLVGYWSFDEDAGTTVPDHSGNGNTGTATNGPTGTTGQLGRALNFDGSDDYVGNSSMNIGLNGLSQISVSAWVKRNSTGSLQSITNKELANGGWDTWNLAINASNNLVFDIANDTHGGFPSVAGSTSLTTGVWYHVVATWLQSSGGASDFKLYVNGVSESVTLTTNSYNGSFTLKEAAKPLGIGVRRNNSGSFLNYFNGSLDDVRIYNRALSASEITRLYHSAGKVTGKNPSISGLVGHWAFDSGDIVGTNVSDRSGSGNAGTTSGGPTTTKGKLGQALNFDVVDDYVAMDGTADDIQNLTTGTISLWVKMDNINLGGGGVTSQMLFAVGDKDDALSLLSVYFNGDDKDTYAFCGEAGVVGYNHGFTGDSDFVVGDWTHIVLVQNGTSPVLYQNGAGPYAIAGGGTPSCWASTVLGIDSVTLGGRISSNVLTQPLAGSLDDVRIYNRALSAAEITTLYATRPAMVNVSPTSRLTSGLVGYWTFDGKDTSGTTALDRSGNGSSMTPFGVAPTKVVGKHGQGMEFNGLDTGGALAGYEVTSGTALTTTAGAACAWIYPYGYPATSNSTQRGNILELWQFPNNLTFLTLNTSGQMVLGEFNSSNITGNAVTRNQWSHTCGTWDGSLFRLYQDGALIASGADGTVNSSQTYWTIGRPYNGGGNSFNGKIDDVRIYNRALSASEVSQLYNAGR